MLHERRRRQQPPNLLATMAPITAPSSSAAPPSPVEPQPGPTTLRPSIAIQQGADRLVELVEHEKSAIASLYHQAMKGLEANHKKYQENNEVMLRSIERKIEKRDVKINELQKELHWARQMALDGTLELEKLRKEHEALKASLTEVGIVCVDGRLEFNNDVARVVDEFVQGVRIQQNALLSSRLGSILSSASLEENDVLSGPIGPADFFNLLSTVMDQTRRFAENLGKQYQQERDTCPTNTQSGDQFG